MCYRVFIVCHCDKEYKIVHSFFYIEENGHFIHETTKIYFGDNELTEKQGRMERSEAKEYTKCVRIINCRCNTCRCKIDSFKFSVNEKNSKFYIRDITCSFECFSKQFLPIKILHKNYK
jgi:hypothetical protein